MRLGYGQLYLLYSSLSLAAIDDGSVLHHGESTFYEENGLGHCGCPPSLQPTHRGAINHEDYGGAASCGTWVNITGPNREIPAYIDNECPEYKKGDIDLSPAWRIHIVCINGTGIDMG